MNHPKKTPALILLAFASLTFAGQANACKYDWQRPDRYFKCLTNEAKTTAERIVADANANAQKIKSDAVHKAKDTLNAALATAASTKAAEPQLCE